MKQSYISESTFFPISLIIILLGTVGAGAWWASTVQADVNQSKITLDEVKLKHEEFKDEVIKELQDVNGTLIEIKTVLKQKRRDE